MKTLNDLEELISVIMDRRASLVFIEEKGCPHCGRSEDAVQLLEAELFPDFFFYRISIDQHPELIERFRLIGVPAFLKVSEIGERKLLTGSTSVEVLRRFLKPEIV